MDSDAMKDKRVGITIQGTKADWANKYFGWRDGRHERGRGFWVELTTSDTAYVIVGTEHLRDVPRDKLVVDRPSTETQNVVALAGENIGREYQVVTFNVDSCGLKPRPLPGTKPEKPKRGRKKVKEEPSLYLPTNILALVR